VNLLVQWCRRGRAVLVPGAPGSQHIVTALAMLALTCERSQVACS
jgi:hypothetical protein